MPKTELAKRDSRVVLLGCYLLGCAMYELGLIDRQLIIDPLYSTLSILDPHEMFSDHQAAMIQGFGIALHFFFALGCLVKRPLLRLYVITELVLVALPAAYCVVTGVISDATPALGIYGTALVGVISVFFSIVPLYLAITLLRKFRFPKATEASPERTT
jgi:hypothetical protein